MILGVLRIELHVPGAQSLKDKRSAIKSVKEQMRSHFNVSASEVDANDTWQRATLGVSTVGDEPGRVNGLLAQVKDWLHRQGAVHVIRIEEECSHYDPSEN